MTRVFQTCVGEWIDEDSSTILILVLLGQLMGMQFGKKLWAKRESREFAVLFLERPPE